MEQAKIERKLETLGDYQVLILDLENQINTCKEFLASLNADIESLNHKKENSDAFSSLDQSHLDTKLNNKPMVERTIVEYEKQLDDAYAKHAELKGKRAQ